MFDCNFDIQPHDVTIAVSFYTVRLSQRLDEGIFKAGAERSETRGAAEVQEDEDTQVEIPVDQVISMPLKIRINQLLLFFWQVLCYLLRAVPMHMLVKPS